MFQNLNKRVTHLVEDYFSMKQDMTSVNSSICSERIVNDVQWTCANRKDACVEIFRFQ